MGRGAERPVGAGGAGGGAAEAGEDDRGPGGALEDEEEEEGPPEEAPSRKRAGAPGAPPPAGTGSRKRARPCYRFGNYPGYYGYRGAAATEARLAALRPEWFAGHRCLDIGCNGGDLTLELVQRFRPRSLVGLDIDKTLVKAAVRALARRRAALGEAYREAGRLFRSSTFQRPLPLPPPAAVTEAEARAGERAGRATGVTGEASPEEEGGARAAVGAGRAEEAGGLAPGKAGTPGRPLGDRAVRLQRKGLQAELQALRGVRFEVANFLDWGGGRAGEFHAVTCLSVVKWVHINWGDAGLRALLARVADLLAPGGVLVLEPQPWTSYAAAFRKQDMAACEGVHLPQSLKLRPDDIGPELEHLGLACVPGGCTPADAAAPGTPANFQRPLLVYQKPLGSASGGGGGG